MLEEIGSLEKQPQCGRHPKYSVECVLNESKVDSSMWISSAHQVVRILDVPHSDILLHDIICIFLQITDTLEI